MVGFYESKLFQNRFVASLVIWGLMLWMRIHIIFFPFRYINKSNIVKKIGSEKIKKIDIFSNDKLFLKVIVVFIIIIIGIIIPLELIGLEFSNNATLVVEIGVGIVIALFVHKAFRKSEKDNQKTLEEIRKMVRIDYTTSSDVKKDLDEKFLQGFNELKLQTNHMLRNIQDKENSSNEQIKKDIPGMLSEFSSIKEKIDQKLNKIYLENSEVITEQKQKIIHEILNKSNSENFNKNKLIQISAIAKRGIKVFSNKQDLSEI